MDMMITVFIMNALYFIIWVGMNKIRNSNHKTIREWDNGYEFYALLNDEDKELYWKQDTHILNIVFAMLLVFIECTLFLVYKENQFWIGVLIIGLILSITIGLYMSIKLRRKYQAKIDT